ncbi:MAG: VOC family protein [Acidimicrobiales bacterium]
MGERTEYAPGTPSWVDIGSDVDAAKAFYGALFGWEAEDAGPVEETGGYGLFRKGGKLVAGYGPKQAPGPPYWTTYVSVADADETAAKVRQAGGSVLMEPGDVFTAGRMAVFADQQGAPFSVWQPQDHIGAELVNEPGSFSWNELNTRDVAGSLAFYTAVFGWGSQTHEMPTGSYSELKLGDRSIAGLIDMTGRVPDEVPAHWMVYFSVEDCDASITKAKDLGGSVVVGPFDLPIGRFAVVRDPQGAHFAAIRLNHVRG